MVYPFCPNLIIKGPLSLSTAYLVCYNLYHHPSQRQNLVLGAREVTREKIHIQVEVRALECVVDVRGDQG